MIASIWNSQFLDVKHLLNKKKQTNQFLEVEPENQEIILVVALDGPGVQSWRSGFGRKDVSLPRLPGGGGGRR